MIVADEVSVACSTDTNGCRWPTHVRSKASPPSFGPRVNESPRVLAHANCLYLEGFGAASLLSAFGIRCTAKPTDHNSKASRELQFRVSRSPGHCRCGPGTRDQTS